MVARQRSTSPNPIFNESWIAVVRVRAKSQLNGKRKIGAKFFPACLKAKRLARQLEFLSETKMRGHRTTPKSPKNSGPHTQTLLTKRNTEFGIGRVGDVLLRVKRSVGSR